MYVKHMLHAEVSVALAVYMCVCMHVHVYIFIYKTDRHYCFISGYVPKTEGGQIHLNVMTVL